MLIKDDNCGRIKTKRTVKDSVFTALFKDKKNLLKMYRALHPEDTKSTERDNINNQYIIFCKVFDNQRNVYGLTKNAVKETIRICKDRNILREYLESREKEAVTIMGILFSDEEIMENYVYNKVEEAKEEADLKTAERMIKKGKMTLEEIAEYVPSLSMQELQEIEAEVMNLA
jgi:hypothetical protein